MTDTAEPTRDLSEVRGVIVDLDGTVYRGEGVLPGAADAIAELRSRGIRVCFCSNNPTKTPAEYVDRLAGMGIEADESMILPASTVTRDFLRDHNADDPTYLVGSASLADYLRESGQHLVEDPAEASVFVSSWDETFDYAAMTDALAGIDDGTTFLGTDPDRTIPTADGFVPGSGAITGAIARTVGREPDRVLGKPSPEATADALDRLGVPAENCLVVGDRLDTDLAMGARNGMATALVLTGVSDRADAAESEVDPDFVLDSLADLPSVIA
ncbi:HAD-IIA family hydrolase [Halosimplex sp. TS25]|uniref:HAD-IIA family hydrolase n=1 Tax=Halosimplex rarum TaxID=3396619 RepID=UPI0039E784BE